MKSEPQDGSEYQVEEAEVRGHRVRIIEGTDRVDLIVDDAKWDYFETDDGVTLRRDAYRGPYRTLVEAVESYFDFYEGGAQEESGA